jgi:hypothetical protein
VPEATGHVLAGIAGSLHDPSSVIHSFAITFRIKASYRSLSAAPAFASRNSSATL